ncbi:MAG: hypothetical protein WAX69_01745 [Victivallales bacterium]
MHSITKILNFIMIAGVTCCWNMSAADVVSGDTAEVSNSIESACFVEGKLTRVSKLPDPAKSNYKNCYFTTELEILNIISGTASADRIILVLPGFYDRKLTSESNYKVGDLLRLKIVPFDSLPQEAQSIQQADELENFALDIYFASQGEKLDKLPAGLTLVPPSSKRISYVSGFEKPLNPPLPQALLDARKVAIQHDLDSVKVKLNIVENDKLKLISNFERDWELKQKELVPVGTGFRWGKVGRGYFTLSDKYNPFLAPDWNGTALPALKSLNEYLTFHNIQLIVVVIPDMFQVSSRALMPKYAPYADQNSLNVVRTLLENDIEAIDISGALVEKAKDYPLMFFYDKISDSHPEYGVVDIATDILVQRLSRFDGIVQGMRMPTDRFSLIDAANPIGRVWPVDSGTYKAGDIVLTKKVLFDGEEVNLKDKTSPFLLLGNSYSGMPGWGAFSCFAGMKTGIVPYHCSVSGAGLGMIIPKWLLARRELLLKGKKVCFMPVGVNHLSRAWLDVKELDKEMCEQKDTQLIATIPSNQLLKAFTPNTPLNQKELQQLIWQKQYLKDEMTGFSFFKLPAEGISINNLPLPESVGEGKVFVKISFRHAEDWLPFIVFIANGKTMAEKIGTSPVELMFSLEAGKLRKLDMKIRMKYYPKDIILGVSNVQIFQKRTIP